MTQLKYTGVLETTRLRKEVGMVYIFKSKYNFQNVFHKWMHAYILVFSIDYRVIQSALLFKNSFEGTYISNITKESDKSTACLSYTFSIIAQQQFWQCTKIFFYNIAF